MPSHKRAEASEVSAAWVRWRGPIFYPSGYGDETRNIALGLERLGVRVAARHVGPFSSIFRRQLDPEKCARLEALIARETTPGHIGVSAFPADAFELEAGVGRHVGRTMFETDGLPNHWVEKCNLMDEIWVPTDFNLETFARAGVKTRLEKVPHGVDSRLFRPGAEPLPIAGARGRVFLSIFEWGFRKGWDVLLDSWSRAFHRDDDVTLVLRTFIHPADSYSGDEIERRIDAYLASRLLSREAVAPIVVLGNQIPEDELPSLYASAAAYVGPSRGEGWGRPYMEAMACGVPVIATRWSGCTEFLDDSNALLIDIEGLEPIDERTEIPSHVGHRWAIPSREHLVDLLRSARRPDLVDPLARRAREDVVARWSWEQAAAVVARRLEALRDDVVTARARPVRVSWLSPDEKYRALHIVDAELRSRLAIDPRFVLDPDASGPGAPAIAVQHQWPPPLEPPEHGRWVVILHWDYGSLPVEWLEAWRGRVDEFWVPSQYVASGLVDDGIPADRVGVVRWAVSQRFRPGVAKLALETKKTFKLLFVGATVWRKGIDILMTSYLKAFRSSDDVCLVVKDAPPGSGHAGTTHAESIRRCQRLPGAPQIEYVDRALSDDEMAGLYAACDCLVQPFRAEGFCLPIAEAMASELPVMLTGYGPPLEYCDADSTYQIPAVEVKSDTRRVDVGETADYPRHAEPDAAELERLLRHVVANPLEAREKGRRARLAMRSVLSWTRSADTVATRLTALAGREVLRDTAPARATSALSALETGRHRFVFVWEAAEARVDGIDESIADRLAPLLGVGFELDRGQGVPADIVIQGAGGGFRVSTVSRQVECASADDLLVVLVTWIVEALLGSSSCMFLHSGAFVLDERAVLFVGPERAGKSSLAFAAWRQGLPVIGDDVVVIDPAGATVRAAPRPLKLRPPGGKLPEGVADVPRDQMVRGVAEGEPRLVLGRGLSGMVPLDSEHPIEHLFLLGRGSEAESRLSDARDSREVLATVLEAASIVALPDMKLVRLLRRLRDDGRVSQLEVGVDDWARAIGLVADHIGVDAG